MHSFAWWPVVVFSQWRPSRICAVAAFRTGWFFLFSWRESYLPLALRLARQRAGFRLARLGTKLCRPGAGPADLRSHVLDGGDGGGGRKTLRCDRRLDWTDANLSAQPGRCARLLEQRNDVIIIDLDSNPEYALELVESICANGAATVMVYSVEGRSGPAGALHARRRPRVSHPALRAQHHGRSAGAGRGPPPATRTQESRRPAAGISGRQGRLGRHHAGLQFCRGPGPGVGQSTLLIDLDLPLGDAALNLGIVPSTRPSMRCRMPPAGCELSSKLLVKHSSGVSVLAAPGKFPQFQATNEAIDKLMTVARQEFDNVVVDVGSQARSDRTRPSSRMPSPSTWSPRPAFPELRNSNRLISQFFTAGGPESSKIVINRYEPRSLGVSDETHHQGAHPAGQLEDSQRLRRGAADAEHRHSAGAGRFAHFAADQADGRSICGTSAQRNQKKKGFSFSDEAPE
jgi:hypothetical protein